MTIVGSIFHEESPLTSFIDWTRSRRVFGQYSRLHDIPHRSSSWGLPAPSEFHDSQRYCYQDYNRYGAEECSDSDCEMYDINTNSRPRSARVKRFSKSSTSKPKPNAVVETRNSVPEVITIDDDEVQDGTRRKQIKFDSTESKNIIDVENLYPRRSSRSSTSNASNSSVGYNDRVVHKLSERDLGENSINDTCNYAVYEYLKAFLKSTGRQIDAMKGDGNCFFRALSKVIYGSQSFYDDIRQAVVDVLERHSKHFEAFTDGPMAEHIADIRKDKTWATQSEIYAAATLLNRDIYILSPDQSGETYRWLLFKPLFKYNTNTSGCQCYITICHTHGNHYDRIAVLGSKACNCGIDPPELSGVTDSVDLTAEDEIV